MRDKYIVVRSDEDGNVSMEVFDKETLIQCLDKKYWGRIPNDIFRDGHPSYVDLREKSVMYIIKGDFVQPTIKESIITTWTIA